MSKTFLQYKGTYAKKRYPSWSKRSDATYTNAGCGPCSVAAIVYNKNSKITPLTVGNYISTLKTGATSGGATYQSAITTALRHYGFTTTQHGKMSDFLTQMKKGNRWGIILFKAGTKGGIKWTSGGHYIAVTDIKVKNGKHYLYMRDSGKRGHIGWYCYETQMQGLCKACWTCYLPQ